MGKQRKLRKKTSNETLKKKNKNKNKNKTLRKKDG